MQRTDCLVRRSKRLQPLSHFYCRSKRLTAEENTSVFLPSLSLPLSIWMLGVSFYHQGYRYFEVTGSLLDSFCHSTIEIWLVLALPCLVTHWKRRSEKDDKIPEHLRFLIGNKSLCFVVRNVDVKMDVLTVLIYLFFIKIDEDS